MIHRLTTLAAKAILFAVASLTASAATLTFDSSLQYARPGDTVAFSGTLLNDGATTVFLNGASATFPLAFDTLPFFAAPLSLAPGESYSGPMLNVIVPGGAALGQRVGSFDVQGGPDALTFDVIASTTFGVVVIPEPSTLGFAIGGLGLLAVRSLRRKQ